MGDSFDLILYDGVCGLCNRLNLFVLKRDRTSNFRFAPLQSRAVRFKISAYGKDPDDLDTVYLIQNYGSDHERVLVRSTAIAAILSRLPGIWKPIGIFLKFVPRFLRDLGYRIVARTRYRIFGKYDRCPTPKKEWQSKFILDD